MAKAAQHPNPYRVVWAMTDAVVWACSVLVAVWLRFDLAPHRVFNQHALLLAGTAGLIMLVIGFSIGPYSVGHIRGSFEEVTDLARACVLTTVLVAIPIFVTASSFAPRSVPFLAGPLALATMLAMRLAVRAFRQRQRQRTGDREMRRVVVFGAGEGGRLLVRAMKRDHFSGFDPVAVLDDSPHKSRLNIEGVRVRGTRDSLSQVAAKYNASALAIAVPSAHAGLIRDLRDRAAAAGLDVLVLPQAKEMLGAPTTHSLRDVKLADLLGRRPIRLDDELIRDSITHKRVLVTGAGGSIGAELCVQIAKHFPSKIFMLDRDESGLHSTQLSLDGNGLLNTDTVVLADIRDAEAMREVMRRLRPDIVFHAAALKHLPLLERFPLEAWKSNVIGTYNVLAAADEFGVSTVVNISTDKAADPTSALGYSKRCAERVTAGFARRSSTRFVSVRFGNVLGSRGSVIHAFTAQIERGGPVTVTHPDVERFFMLIPEACQLVLEAAAIGSDGEVMVLDMGEPMKIAAVARTLIDMSGRSDIAIAYTGLRPGEKLTEDLFSATEARHTTDHELVTSVAVPPISPTSLTAFEPTDHASAMGLMQAIARGEIGAQTAVPAERTPDPTVPR